MEDSKIIPTTPEEIGIAVAKTVIAKTGEIIIKNAPEEVQAGSIIGGTAMAASGAITVGQAAIVGVAMPALATIGGFIAVGAAVGGIAGGIRWFGKKRGWF